MVEAIFVEIREEGQESSAFYTARLSVQIDLEKLRLIKKEEEEGRSFEIKSCYSR